MTSRRHLLTALAGVAIVLTILAPFVGIPLAAIVAFVAHRQGRRTLRNVLAIVGAVVLAWILFVFVFLG